MTAALDFGALPPEVNSARMYAGGGAGSLLVAASAWKGLAAELRSTALSYGAVLSALTDEEWRGPASAAMATAASPYVAWLNSTAVQAEQAASQAEAAAAAYEAALAGTVPPAQVAANRLQLAKLVATNYLGRNMPAISANEAQYSDMWAQDAATMYQYAAASSAATDLTPFADPPQSTDPAGAAAQGAAVGQATSTPTGTVQAFMSRVRNALQSMADPAPAQVTPEGPSSTPPFFFGNPFAALGDLFGFNPFAPGSAMDADGFNGVLNAIFGTNTAFGQFLNSNILNDIASSGLLVPTAYAAGGGGSGGGGGGGGGETPSPSAPAEGAAPAGPSAPCPGPGGPVQVVTGGGGLGFGGHIHISTGVATNIGQLSVPPTWTGEPGALSPALGATPMKAPAPTPAVGMAGVPMAGLAGAGAGYGRHAPPQYGFKPNFIARPPSAG